MKKFYLTLIVLFVILQGNAQLKKFNVEVPTPAKFKISDSIQSFTILNRSLTSEFNNYHRDSLQVSFYRNNFEDKRIILDSLVSDTIVKALGELLFESQRFDVVIPVDRNIPRKVSFTKTPERIDWAYAQTICETYDTDALIVLENFATQVVTNYETGKDYINGMATKTHYASMDYYYRAHWRIYDPKTQNVIVDFIMNQDTIFWDNFDYKIVDCFKGIPSVKDAGIETGIKIALDFSEIIAPSWKEETRYYYVTKKPMIDKSIELAAQGNWEEALINWEKYSHQGKGATKSKIMLNMALCYEMLGDIDSAISLAKKSQKIYYREVTNHYIKELLKRQIQLNKN